MNYEYLIVALGITPDYQRVPGLLEALETAPNVCTNYDAKYVSKTFPAIQNTKKGTALFTHPDTPVKCAGAPQKIMYLAEDQIRKSGLRNDVDVAFAHPGPAIFGVKKYAEQLAKVVAEKDIKTYFHHALKELDYKNNLAVFHNIKEPVNLQDIKRAFYPKNPSFMFATRLNNVSRSIFEREIKLLRLCQHEFISFCFL